MATYLYRLGRWSAERRRVTLIGWLALLVLMGIGSVTIAGSTSNAFSIPGTESQRALDLLNDKFPGSGGASARIVFAAPEGERITAGANRGVVEQVIEDARSAPEVISVDSDPFVTGTIGPGGRIGFADVSYAVSVDKLEDTSKEALAEVAAPARDAGVAVEFSGGVVATTAGGGEAAVSGIAIAFVVLLITFGSLVAAGMPILTAGIGVGIALLGIQTLSGLIEPPSTAPTLAIMIGLAVGIDYALFILSRHRQQLLEGAEVTESIARATATAGSAVVFAGLLPLVIALAGLSVVGIPFLTVMGLGAAGTVVVAVLIAVALVVPALMAFAGPRLGRPRRRRANTPKAAPVRGPATRWAGFVTRRPIPVLLAGVIVMGIIAIPALDMRLGLPDDSQKAADTTERRAYDLLADGFGPGFSGPLTIVGRRRRPGRPGKHRTAHRPGARAAPRHRRRVAPRSIRPARWRSSARRRPPVRRRARPPTWSPASAPGRTRWPRSSAFDILVTGTTAVNIDVSDKLAAALPLFLVVIVGLALVLLALVFRSILVPVKAILGFLLTIAASLGIVVWVFQQGHLADLFGVESTGPIVSFLPILLISILFGLAMDYEVFLVTRMREAYVESHRPREAVIEGFRASGKVVAVAAIIMIAVFGGFIFGPDAIIKSIGLALAFGVLVDAFIVRMTIVPAVLALLGHSAWWLPRRLDQVMPNVDIEGRNLVAQPAPQPSATAPPP